MLEDSIDSAAADLYHQLEIKIAHGQDLVQTLCSLNHVRGIEKLKRKINKEVVFLRKIFQNRTAKEEHINCTNVNHFTAMVACLLECKNIVAVMEGYYGQKTQSTNFKKILIDIICEGGKKWVKVIARNPQALTQLSNGNGTYGKRNVFDQGKEYLQAAREHPYMFHPPVVEFHFAAGVESILANQLSLMEIAVTGQVINENFNQKLYPDFTSSDSECPTEEEDAIAQKCPDNGAQKQGCDKILNLDVTTMLAYVSALTNVGSDHTMDYDYPNDALKHQAECEQAEPVKPILEQLFKGKKLISCQSAASSFQSIVAMVGGPSEQTRAKDFMSRIEIVPDEPTLPENFALQPGGQIHPRSLTVFSTGHNLQAMTVSANSGLVRSAKCKGIDFVVFLHPSRALTEKKMVLRQHTDLPQMEAGESSTSHC